MAGSDDLLTVIEAIHAAGLDAARWPKALAGMARLIGGAAATLELFPKRSLRPTEFYFHGVPPAIEIKYLDHFVKLNRRLPIVAADPLGRISWDYRLFDEETIEHDPFYMEFLRSLDLRYFVGGIVLTNREEFAGVCVHRSPRQGHVDRAGVALMERLLPHVRAAFDVTRRIKAAGAAHQAFVRALDWLADGVALVRDDGTVVHANRAFEAIARQADGLSLRHGQVELAGASARSRFGDALRAVNHLNQGDVCAASRDFTVSRASGAPSYVVSVRPLSGAVRADAAADAAVFVRDPAGSSSSGVPLLRASFALTEAEASLAEALRGGMALGDYAAAHGVSLNTVYTHLRGIKEKTGCRRLPELIRKLNDLIVAARPE